MRETAPAVRSQNSVVRDLFPFYSFGQFAFCAILLAGIYVVMRRLDPPTAAVVTLGSLLGMAAVGTISKPAWMLVRPNKLDELEVLLVKQGYNHERPGEWVPSLPRWLRWSYNKVRIGTQEGAVLITGPAIVLRGLIAELDRQP